MRPLARLVHLLTAVLPRRVRVRFADDLRTDVEHLRRDARRRGGRLGEAAYIVRELAGLVRLAFDRRHPAARPGDIRMTERLLSDLAAAWRAVRRRPLFSATAAATLAVAIAAATTALGLTTAILWRPLPFDDEQRVAFLWENSAPSGPSRPSRVTGSRYAAWRDHARTFEAMALFSAAGFSLEGPDGRLTIRGVRVSVGYFDALGVKPLLGRTFTAADEIDGQQFVVVLSHDAWQQRFGGRADVVGTTIRLSAQPYTIVGVMPPIVFPAWPLNPAAVTLDPQSRQVWVPIVRNSPIDQNARSHVHGVVGRLSPGVSYAQAFADLAGLSAASPDPHGVLLTPLRAQLTSGARQPLLLVLASALAVLLVACANLAALYLASFEGRRAELATRASLGAGAPALARLLTLEALAVAGVGGAAGVALARVVLAWLPGALPPTVPFVTAPSLDLGTALIAAAGSLVAGLALAAWPVGRLLRHGPAPRGLTGRARSRAFGALVAWQIAVTVALVSAAGWLGQSLWSVESRDPGFAIDDVVVADVSIPSREGQTPADVVSSEDRVRAALVARHGVRGAALAYDHPLEANWTDGYVLMRHDSRLEEPAAAQLRIVSPSYFEMLGVAVLEGRAFSDGDGLGRGGVAMVNEAFARNHEGGVMGRPLRSQAAARAWGDAAPDSFTIVGIVEDERFRGLEEPSQPAVYLSTRQFPQTGYTLLVRADQPRELAADLRAMVRATEPRAAIEPPELLSSILADQLAPRRLTTDVLSGFAGATLLLAAMGLYGLLALMVASQRRDVGVRLALGATPSSAARAVMASSLRHVAFGLAGGLVLAMGAGRMVQGMMVGVTVRDPVTIATVLTVMLLTALASALVPALRAARVNPVDALRAE